MTSALRRTLAALAITLTTACSSVQNRYVAMPVDPTGQPTGSEATPSGLIVSGEELTSYSSDHFGLIEVTFENPTHEWLHVERLALDFGSPERNAAVLLPEGSDIVAWHQATINRNEIRGTNEAAALGALLALGAIVAIAGRASGEGAIETTGKAVAVGAASAAAIDDLGARADGAERVRLLTETHLLAVPFGIPPGLFAKRWVLLESHDIVAPCIASMWIDYTVERGNERVLLRFRRAGANSAWQRRSCAARSLASR